MEIFFISIGIFCAALGVIGSVAPVLPGPILSYASLFFLYFAKDGAVSGWVLIFTGIITFLIFILGNFIPVAVVKVFGASKAGLLGCFVGAIIGIFIFPPFGVFVGALLGAILGEFYAFNNIKKAMGAGIGAVLGSIAVLLIQTIFSVSVLVYLIFKLF